MREGHPQDRVRESKEAYACAEAFQNLAETFISSITSIPEDLTSTMSQQMAALVACATNLSFAVELYLKALLLHFKNLPVPRTHDLRRLWDQLPRNVQSLIEDTYTISYRKEWLGRRASVTLALGPPRVPEWPDNTTRPNQLPDVLSRSRTLFESWRYIFESHSATEQNHELHEFEYGLLRTAAEALRVEIKLRIQDESR